jgi:hypothetical protein
MPAYKQQHMQGAAQAMPPPAPKSAAPAKKAAVDLGI